MIKFYFLDNSYYLCNINFFISMDTGKDINRIKVMLAEKKRTSKWLAEQLRKDPATISKWCTNAAQPTLDVLLEIADLLEVKYTELVRR